MPRINDEVTIGEDELRFEFARSSGPGGQNVNKVETKVTLLFSVRNSPSLSDERRARLEECLSSRITKHGVLRVTSQRHRTREANRRATVERFVDLLADALEEREQRVSTKVPAAKRRRRLEDKKRRSRVKALRAKPEDDD
ncbi:MAG: aminoacyl-tRNA hydrolase [Acidobacteria bacterium]|nr:aminoacyl-tRNA hydrolase [Acidobacteriota bacterium]